MGAEQRPPAPEAEQPRSEFYQTLENRWSKGLFVCVGLDSEFAKIPDFLKNSVSKSSESEAIYRFNKAIIDATADLACAFKPNSAFYEAEGKGGMEALKRTISYIKDSYPNVPVILDYKRGDIGNTNLVRQKIQLYSIRNLQDCSCNFSFWPLLLWKVINLFVGK